MGVAVCVCRALERAALRRVVVVAAVAAARVVRAARVQGIRKKDFYF